MNVEELDAEKLPRCESLDGSTLKIVPSYTEAGYFCEANCVEIEDEAGRRALYVPYKILPSITPPSQNTQDANPTH